jgi:hypothetical protein
MWIRMKGQIFGILRRLGGEVPNDSALLREHIFKTYLWLRRGMGLIAFAFPFLLVGVGWLVYGLPWQDEMSAYYWASLKEGGDAPMRVWFVGVLFALGCCLFLYKGYSRLEDWVLNVAALCAICVAIVPMCWPTESECPIWRKLHGGSAIVFFVLLAIVAVLHGLWAWGYLRSRPRELLEDQDPSKYAKYAKWYVGTALLMALAPLGAWYLFSTNSRQIFWAEFTGISAFCVFWVVQIVQISKSQFDWKLAQRDSSRQRATESLTEHQRGPD